MKDKIEFAKKELEKFNGVIFDEPTHTYSVNGYVFPRSMTTYIKQFHEVFDDKFHSARIAIKRNLTQQEVLDEWNAKSKESTDLIGTPFHKFMECKYNGYNLPTEYYGEKYQIVKKQGELFFEKNIQRLIHVKSEVIVWSFDFDIVGTFDQLFFNTDTYQFELWDWKTSETIDLLNKYRKFMYGEFSGFPDLNFYHYSLQLSLYKFLIETYTNIKISHCRIGHFSHLNPSYKIYTAHDFYPQIKKLFNL